MLGRSLQFVLSGVVLQKPLGFLHVELFVYQLFALLKHLFLLGVSHWQELHCLHLDSHRIISKVLVPEPKIGVAGGAAVTHQRVVRQLQILLSGQLLWTLAQVGQRFRRDHVVSSATYLLETTGGGHGTQLPMAALAFAASRP